MKRRKNQLDLGFFMEEDFLEIPFVDEPEDQTPLEQRELLATQILERLADKQLRPFELALQATEQYPYSCGLLELAALAALVEERPDIGLRFLKKLKKRFLPILSTYAWQAIALAQQGNWSAAQNLFHRYGLVENQRSYRYHFPPVLERWGSKWLHDISKWKPPRASTPRHNRTGARPQPGVAGRQSADSRPGRRADDPLLLRAEPLPRLPAQIPVHFELPGWSDYQFDSAGEDSLANFVLRNDFAQLSLLKGFDSLLCLDQLGDVDHYWYQLETVRKVLRQFRGRVLLADEVGLGKTIEAGMVLKEYLLRGMAERVLILTPASLVGQWREEMETKFGIDFITTHDPLLQKDPADFWSRPRIIASIATARRDVHFQYVVERQADLVIVDEAHHLKNRLSKNWKLVDALKKRFLLLLSATPVENNLLELYNLLTLLRPGIFKTEKEFRSIYMTPHNPRVPANRARLQELIRDVMIRNTRALVDVRLPARHAVTVMVDPSAEETTCYTELSRLIRSMPPDPAGHRRRPLHYLLEAAGSSAAAVGLALGRFLEHTTDPDWGQLQSRYAGLSTGASKVGALIELLLRNPDEKKMVFVRFRETLEMLDGVFRQAGVSFVRFDGQMSGPQKDAAIESFRQQAAVLLCTESGGEGRNVQFCNTVVNFDLPWNPQVIEQRIGRVHRIGQSREVFVFNLATRNSIEEQVLKILDEKINMFELVCGEVQSILGEMEDDQDFAHMIFSAWTEQTEEGRQRAFERLGEQLAGAKKQYDAVKALDDELFGEGLETA